MGYIIPMSELGIEDIIALKQKVISQTMQIASQLTGLSQSDLIVRNILPHTDLGLAAEYWKTPDLTADTWNEYFSTQLADQRFIVFYGLANLSPNPVTTGIRFSVGAGRTKILDVIQYEDIYSGIERAEGVFSKYIIYKHKQYCNVDVYAKAAGADNLLLRGLVVEPKGVVSF